MSASEGEQTKTKNPPIAKSVRHDYHQSVAKAALVVFFAKRAQLRAVPQTAGVSHFAPEQVQVVEEELRLLHLRDVENREGREVVKRKKTHVANRSKERG